MREEKSSETSVSSNNYKAKKEAEDRENAGNSVIGDSLFIRSDIAVGAVAAQLGVRKGDIMDETQSGKDSLAVRVAVSEAQVIAQTKQFLAKGVSLEALRMP